MKDYHPELQCRPISIAYDFTSRVGLLVLDEYECCDQGGCIALFKLIDPDVRQVQTVAGNELDTVYTRTSTGWLAA